LKKNVIIIFAFVIIGLLVISGCVEDRTLTAEEKKLVGTWKGSIILGFFSDGTCYDDYELNHKYGVWKIDDGKLIITWINGKVTLDYELSNNDIELSLYDEGQDTPRLFRRQ
jgi:hypothetical protein